MKTILIQLGGTMTKGDLVIVGYRGKRGGQSAVKCAVIDRGTRDVAIPVGATLDDVAAALASEINKGKDFLPNEFSATAKNARLVVHCSDLVSDVEFFAEVEGEQTETVAIDTI